MLVLMITKEPNDASELGKISHPAKLKNY